MGKKRSCQKRVQLNAQDLKNIKAMFISNLEIFWFDPYRIKLLYNSIVLKTKAGDFSVW